MRKFLRAALFALLALCTGCEKKPQQSTLEARCAAHMMDSLEAYEAEFPGVRMTNMLQLFLYATNSPWGYPHWLDRGFQAYGTNAGFTNSVYEKYVVAPPGVKFNYPARAPRELVLFSAQPFPDPQRQLQRTMIFREGQSFICDTWSEKFFHKFISESGLAIPRLTPLPSPPPEPPPVESSAPPDYSLSQRIQIAFKRFAVALGMQKNLWLTLLILTVAVVFTAVVFFLIWLRRRAR